MASTTTKSAFRAGFIAGLPFVVIGIPFAMLFGVVATEAGLTVPQTMGFSVLVIAGASQFTAVQLMTEAVPVWVVLAASLAVNLRMAMYSASLQPHLREATFWQRVLVAYLNVDASYAVSISRYEDPPELTTHEKVTFFMGTMILTFPLWFIFTYVGAVAGSAIPEGIALDFAMPILFFSLVGPMLKTLAHLAAAVSSVVLALIFTILPSGIGILIAGVIAMAVGAEVERRRGR
ncbi:MAG: branched-chain amino acid ABC transporter permease [Boseongicola sp.]|nr:MAG: branched-chain amino acid ABC transporter permease [Boseongicola sp.]